MQNNINFQNWIITNNDSIKTEIYNIISRYINTSFLGYFTESSDECGRGPQINYQIIEEVIADKNILILDDIYYIFKIPHEGRDNRFNAKFYNYNNHIYYRFSLNAVTQEEGIIQGNKIELDDFKGVATVIKKFLVNN